jgi:integrase
VKLTPASIKALTLPPGVSEKTYFDTLAGFGVRVRASGGRSYVVQYKTHGKNRRVVLGPVGSLDLAKARASAKDILAAVRLGRDPAGERLERQRKVASAFGLLLPRYLERQRSRLKPRSFVETNRHLVRHAAPLHGLAVEAIDRRTIAILLGDIAERSGPFAANRTRASLSGFFSWLLREGIIEANPILATNEAIEGPPRTRVVTDDELAAIWNATENSDPYGAIVRLLMLTGCRRQEIAGLRWSEVDLDQAVIVLPGGAPRITARIKSTWSRSPSTSWRRSRGGLMATAARGTSYSAAAIAAGKIGARAKTSLTPAFARRFMAGICTISVARSPPACMRNSTPRPTLSSLFWVTAGPRRESRRSTIAPIMSISAASR